MDAFFRGTASQEQLAALQSYFSGADHVRCRFQYIGLLGAGAFGVAVRIRETFFDGRPSRDFAIKQANTEAHRRELRWEIERIQRIAGGMHIVQPITVDNSRFYDYDVEEAPKVHPSRWDEQKQAYEREGYLLGPLLVIELLEHGALQDLLNKGKNYDVRHWPNRLLWRFFLCLVRACVAMAYPRTLGNNDQALEEIPPGNGMPSNFTHTDMHAGNEYNDPEEAGITENIFSVGKLMLDLLAGEPFFFNEFIPFHQLKIPKDGGGGGGGTRAVATYAAAIMKQPPGERYEGMDPDLQALVAQCLAVDPANRPALGDLLDRVRQGVARTPADYTGMPWGSAEESDEFILRLLNRVLNDANP
ncbi:kinase-like domain-containing protein [Apiospora sp. TS-2023a]